MQNYITIDVYFAKQISLFGICCLLPVLKLHELHHDSLRLDLREPLSPRGRRLQSPPLCLVLRKGSLDSRCDSTCAK
jgi:hypothetical protein